MLVQLCMKLIVRTEDLCFLRARLPQPLPLRMAFYYPSMKSGGLPWPLSKVTMTGESKANKNICWKVAGVLGWPPMAVDWNAVSKEVLSVVKALGLGAFVTIAATFLIQKFISYAFDRRTEQFKDDLRSESDKQLLAAKHEFDRMALEHGVKFAKVYERRAEAIFETFRALIDAFRKTEKYIYGNKMDHAVLQVTVDVILQLRDLTERNEIIFTDSLSSQLTEFHQKLYRVFWKLHLRRH